MQKKNCRYHTGCGRTPGGRRAAELGICPAAVHKGRFKSKATGEQRDKYETAGIVKENRRERITFIVPSVKKEKV